jgi:hypothetical protein
MERAMEQASLNKPNIFSSTERKIAKTGLCVTIPTGLIYGLYQAFPGNTLIATMFASFGALALIVGILCLMAKPAEVATGKVKKFVNRGWMYTGRLSDSFKTPKRFLPDVLGSQRHTCQTRNNARAHRRTSRPTFSNSSKGHSGDGDPDQGDPPGPSHPVTPLSNSDKKLNKFSFPWRLFRRPGSWRVSCRKSAVRGRSACL